MESEDIKFDPQTTLEPRMFKPQDWDQMQLDLPFEDLSELDDLISPTITTCNLCSTLYYDPDWDEVLP